MIKTLLMGGVRYDGMSVELNSWQLRMRNNNIIQTHLDLGHSKWVVRSTLKWVILTTPQQWSHTLWKLQNVLPIFQISKSNTLILQQNHLMTKAPYLLSKIHLESILRIYFEFQYQNCKRKNEFGRHLACIHIFMFFHNKNTLFSKNPTPSIVSKEFYFKITFFCILPSKGA